MEHDYLIDMYIGKEVMKNVEEKTNLGHIIQSYGKNDKNITDKINKSVGNAQGYFDQVNRSSAGI